MVSLHKSTIKTKVKIIRWELSSKITAKERDVALQRLNVFRDWFFNFVMRKNELDALIIIPIEEISPRYRDEVPRYVH